MEPGLVVEPAVVVGGGGGAVVDRSVVDSTGLEVVVSMKVVGLAETCVVVPMVGVVVTIDSGAEVVDCVGDVPPPPQKKRNWEKGGSSAASTASLGMPSAVATQSMHWLKAFRKSDPSSQSSGILPSFWAIRTAVLQESKHLAGRGARLARLLVFRRTCGLSGL